MDKVLVAVPGEEVKIQQIGEGTQPLKEIVGGPLECVQLGGEFILYCNQEGTERDLPVNPHFSQGIVKGPFVIAKAKDAGTGRGLDEEDVRSVMAAFIRDESGTVVQ